MAARPREMPFAPASETWQRELVDTGKSDNTRDCYARDLRDVAEAIRRRDTPGLLLLDQGAVDAIASKWRHEGASDATVGRRFSALRGFAVHLVRRHGMDLSALLSAKFPPTPKEKRPPVAEREIQCLLSDAQHDGWRDLRDSAMFALQSGSGLTPAETVKLDVEHIDLDARLVRVVNTHLTPRVAGLSDQSRDLIRQYLDTLPFRMAQKEPLFVTSKRRRLNVRSAQVSFRRRRIRLGVSESATLMGLRHALAARLADDGGSPDLLASALGIARIATLRYFIALD